MYSILIVDDEPLALESIRIILSKSALPELTIIEAENGQQALELIQKCLPDVVITDISMPIMDGLALCKNLYKRAPMSKLIIVSGYDEFAYAREAMKYGVKDYLLKPIQENDLVNLLTDIFSEIMNSETFTYVSHSDMEDIAEAFVNGLWDYNTNESKAGLSRITSLLSDVPLEFCIMIIHDLWCMIFSRLSVRIGYSLRMQETLLNPEDKDNLWINFKEKHRQLACELDERRNNSDYNLFEMVRNYISENCDQEITLEDLAREIGFSAKYFSQLFKNKTGKTFVYFRTEVRMIKAMELLAMPENSVTEVALNVGYKDTSYFIRVFKEYTGKTPTEFKKKGGKVRVETP